MKKMVKVLNDQTTAAKLFKGNRTRLSQMFDAVHQSPEDLIFDLFKIPEKEEACIGKLIMVSTPILHSCFSILPSSVIEHILYLQYSIIVLNCRVGVIVDDLLNEPNKKLNSSI